MSEKSERQFEDVFANDEQVTKAAQMWIETEGFGRAKVNGHSDVTAIELTALKLLANAYIVNFVGNFAHPPKKKL